MIIGPRNTQRWNDRSIRLTRSVGITCGHVPSFALCGAMPLRHFLVLLLVCPLLRASSPEFQSALELVNAKRYPEARAALEKIVASQPRNADAWHRLGLVWNARHDEEACRKAVQCLQKAVELAPDNATFLADYGGVSLELANRSRSLAAARTGREALEKAVAMQPDNLDAREGLFQYYTRAPFIAGGSAGKAAAHLAEIRRRNPDRAIALSVLSKTSAKEYPAAFSLCEEALAKDPTNYTALYQYGRTASVSGQNLERGRANLQKALALTPPTPASPTHSHVWYRIGEIEEKLGRRGEAREAYSQALKLDSGNRQASAGLERLSR